MVGPYSPFLPNGRQNNESLVEVRELEFFIKFDCKGGNLIFDVAVLEGDLAGADGSASLFIDWFAARGAYGRVAVGGIGTADGTPIRAPIMMLAWSRGLLSAQPQLWQIGLTTPLRHADITRIRRATSTRVQQHAPAGGGPVGGLQKAFHWR
jgi:hypothetical protein